MTNYLHPFQKTFQQGCTLGNTPAHVACCKLLLESNFCQIHFKKNLICPLPVFTEHSKVSWDFFQMELWMQPGNSLKKPLKSLLLKVPMLWSATEMSRGILWEAPWAVSPALPSSTSSFCGHPLRLGASWGLLFVSRLLQVTQDSEGNIFWSIPSLWNDYGCILWICQADSISSSHLCRFSSLPEHLCDLCCSTALHSCWKFGCLFKAWSRWTNGELFFFPLTHGETLH